MASGRMVVVGEVAGVYGVSGWVRVKSYTEPADALLGYRAWELADGDGWRDAGLQAARQHGKGLIAKFSGVGDRDAAAAELGKAIAVRREALAPTDADEYYWCDLEGLSVATTRGEALGTVAYLIETGANDVLVVQDGDGETLVPFVPGVTVTAVDLDAKRIVVDWERS